GRDLAAASAAVAELGEANLHVHRTSPLYGSVAILPPPLREKDFNERAQRAALGCRLEERPAPAARRDQPAQPGAILPCMDEPGGQSGCIARLEIARVLGAQPSHASRDP